MATNYEKIKQKNIHRYGQDIARVGPLLLSDRYDDRTHFIFELLQNAEDAIRRRPVDSKQPCAVSFILSPSALRFSHYGKLFDEEDVQGICGIGESTKKEQPEEIGKFGIGFKAVYTFTDCPSVHSGDEHFAIDSFVWPRAIAPVDVNRQETLFEIPFRAVDLTAYEDVGASLKLLGPRTLLFLNYIDEIRWTVDCGESGTYVRGKPKPVGQDARRVTVMGQVSGSADVSEEDWLVFSREVYAGDGRSAGYVQVAFAIREEDGNGRARVESIVDSTLVVFFPTIVSTNVGFLIQGPYKTTPSRDNVEKQNKWNHYLVSETALLLVDALEEMKGMGLLDASVLRTLPTSRMLFRDGTLFAPLFEAVRSALTTRSLIPQYPTGHVSADCARMASTLELRQLLTHNQLSSLYSAGKNLAWVSSDVTERRMPELRRYFMSELGIAEIDPGAVLSRLTQTLLEAQSDDWLVRFYDFLQGQPALMRTWDPRQKPIVRLEEGSHVVPFAGKQPQAFLPGAEQSGFPTVRRSIADDAHARAFLKSLGLDEPDPVDDVVANLLPKYRNTGFLPTDDEHREDFGRFAIAFKTDSQAQKDKLVSALRDVSFVPAVDQGTGARLYVKPTKVYLATERLKDLFAGVSTVMIVDDTVDWLRTEAARELLEATGASRGLRLVRASTVFTSEERLEMRKAGGFPSHTGGEEVVDYQIRGLNSLLSLLPCLDREEASKKATLLWQALCELANRRGHVVLRGTYKWTYYVERSTTFSAAFVKKLNASPWIPTPERPVVPHEVVFDDIGLDWEPNPILLSMIAFQAPVVRTLAQEAGLEPDLIYLLKELGVTSQSILRERLGLPAGGEDAKGTSVEEALKELLGTPPSSSSGSADGTSTGEGSSDGGGGGGEGSKGEPATREFISYIGVRGSSGDGLGGDDRYDENMALEDSAIEVILKEEASLVRMPEHNKGYDLKQVDAVGATTRWIEVKSMTGAWNHRPVCLSREQFKCAQDHGAQFWLYVVENADLAAEASIFRIKDPVGKAKYYAFDHGWQAICGDSPLTP